MPVANMADISPDLTCDHTVELLAAAYDNRVNKNKVFMSFTRILCLDSLMMLMH